MLRSTRWTAIYETVIGELTTNGDGSIFAGNYLFTNLPDGKYQVNIADSNFKDGGVFGAGGAYEGYVWIDGPNDGMDSNSQVIPYTLEILNQTSNLTADFGFGKVVCGLSLTKTCLVPAPVMSDFNCSDAKPIDELSMIWNGTQTVNIKAYKGSVGGPVLATIDDVQPGDEVTVSGYAGAAE